MNTALLHNDLGAAEELRERRTIPFDYAFRFVLTGQPGNILTSTVTISIESRFVAASIGYGVVPQVPPIRFGITPNERRCVDFAGFQPGDGPTPINVRGVVFTLFTVGDDGAETLAENSELEDVNDVIGLDCDSRTNIRLPFPASEVEVTVIRQPVDVDVGVAAGELGDPEAITVRALESDGTTADTTSVNGPDNEPQTLRLTGKQIEQIDIVRGAESDLTFLIEVCFTPVTVPLRDITLGNVLDALELQLEGTSDLLRGESAAAIVLKNGFKLNPDVAEAALLGTDGGNGAPLPAGVQANLFQVVGAPADQIQFLYSLVDEGSGREFQSEPILNIAGWGSSDGRRPFRYFARPIVFEPRSTIRLQVTEISEFEGELHVSLQGYKVLGGAGTPTAPAATRPRARARR